MTRPRPIRTPHVCRVIEMAGFQAQTSAADTPIKLVAQVLQGCNPGGNIAAKFPPDPGPIGLCWGLMRRKRRKVARDISEWKPQLLRGHRERQSPQIMPPIPPMPARIADRMHDAVGLVKPDRRYGEAGAVGQVPDCEALGGFGGHDKNP